ncbi:MAG: replicative DNA helicase [Clostridia bacterium]|nr:replicative DNA helicase [Clostridia bacterium]
MVALANWLNRIPPQNNEAEQAVLGSMLLSQDAIYAAMEILRPEDFYREAHQIIYRTILSLNDRGAPVDLLTVTDALRQEGVLGQVGGAAYVASLADVVPTALNVTQYARIVAEKSLLRSIIQVGMQVVEKGFSESEEALVILDQAEQALFNLGQSRRRGSFVPLKDLLAASFDRLEKLYHQEEGMSGLSTGFVDLDRFCSGLMPSDLIILAARPAMGKTSLGLNIAQNVAIKNHLPVAIFSLEMSKEQVAQRVLCSEALVDQQKLRSGQLEEEDWRRLIEILDPLSEAPLYVDDTPASTVMEMRAKARRLKGQKGLALIVIDYLQLIQPSRRLENRVQEISEISRSLKALARELDVPVIVLSQLTRAVEQRQDKRPMLSELRDGGSQEQDSDMVWFIYRDEYYNPDSEKKGVAEIIIAKQRNGPTGVVELGFLKEFTRFVNLEKRYEDMEE